MISHKLFISNSKLILAAIVALSCLIIEPAQALAETKIAVVDVKRIMNESDAAKSIQKQIEAKRKSYQDEVEKHEKELKKIQDSVVGVSDEISKEEFDKKREGFEKKLLDMRKLVQQRRSALEIAASNSLQELRGEVVKVVAELAAENKYTIVITRQNVILAEKSLEITDDVMKNLNKRIKTIKLEIKD